MTNNIRVLMTPHLDSFDNHESGIKRVVEAYFQYLPEYGIELVKPGEAFDLHAVHAGMTGKDADVAHLHGLYWTADYSAPGWEYSANANIVQALRNAKEVTVPLPWVAETLQRDMRFSPHVVPHGIDLNLWEPQKHEQYVLWNKNRNVDVCDPTPMIELAQMYSATEFVTTKMPLNFTGHLKNVRGVGLLKHDVMRKYIMRSMVYLSTTKETFCIGALEAMASGVPVLGFDWGGNQALIEHGVNGYLARPNDLNDLAEGLEYCIAHRDMLGTNGREMAARWNWPDAVEKVAGIYRLALESHPYAGKVSVVIPAWNYAHTLTRAVDSILKQTHPALEIIIVDDGSDQDNTSEVGLQLAYDHENVHYYRKENGGVATARNYGVERAKGEFVVCLDADDEIAPQFLEACVPELIADRSLGLVYTGIWHIDANDNESLSQWPGEFASDKQLTARSHDNRRGQMNQIPTCCVFRKEAWTRTGGYKQRYAPLGAGAEDAEFWARIFSIGYNAKKVTEAGLFIYHSTGRVSTAWRDGSIDKSLLEPEWLAMHPWAVDHQHPFASVATPMDNRMSHPVRQYDQPVVSVIIPVGPGHEEDVKNALDSLESQTFRQWEVIVVWDGKVEHQVEKLEEYPYVRNVFTGSFGGGPNSNTYGAGYARNRGAEIARAPFLIFLDADDGIAPTFIEHTLDVWEETQSVIYTDYLNQIITTPEDLQQNFQQDRIIRYNERTQEALIRGESTDYDCERAQKQPADSLFHWCLVTCLIPKAWHDSIGGFDEEMESFEDVLYHWKLARQGLCYTRIEEPLVLYRLYTGTRRERASLHTEKGREIARNMLQYSKEVLERMPIMGCKGCPGKSAKPMNIIQNISDLSGEQQRMQDANYVLIEYTHPNKGNHHIVGAATKQKYGYRGGGAKFLVHKEDVAAQPHFFRVLQQQVSAPHQEVETLPAPTSLAEPASVLDTSVPETMHVTQDKVVEPLVEGEIPDYIAPKVEEEIQPVVPVRSSMEPKLPAPSATPSANPVDPATIIDNQPLDNQPSDEDLPYQTRAAELVKPHSIAAQDDTKVDLVAIPGITSAIAEALRAAGHITKASILALGIEGLQQINGIGEVRAEAIITALSMDARNG